MSSNNNNSRDLEPFGVKIFTYPDGSVGFTVNLPYESGVKPEIYADFTTKLDTQLSKHFKSVSTKPNEESKPDKEVNITMSNANKDNALHVSVIGHDKEAVLKAYSDAFNQQEQKEDES